MVIDFPAEASRISSLTDGVITLRRPSEADAPVLARLVRASHTEVSRFLPFAHAGYSADEALGWIRAADDEDRWVITDEVGSIVGTCGLNRFSELNRFANLGYWIATAATGRGAASRAVVLLARYGFEHRDLERVEISMSVENDASRRVAEKAGATYEGTRRKMLRLHGRQHDAHTYSLVRGDPMAPPAR
jgi:ribosomal-protein-serine acetyltransferase